MNGGQGKIIMLLINLACLKGQPAVTAPKANIKDT